MENKVENFATRIFRRLITYIVLLISRILSMGPIPKHIAFILDGNRRYAKKLKVAIGKGHRAGFHSVVYMMVYCYQLGVRYVTIYVFSIENFKRSPEEVQDLMDLLLEKIECDEADNLIKKYGIRVYFIGNLNLLSEPIRASAERVMKATSHNSNITLNVCIAYTSTDEIVHAVQESCQEKWNQIQAQSEEKEQNEVNRCITVAEIERHMYMAVSPDPDVVVRTSDETRLSNFLLWQTSNCLLYSPKALWPEIGLRHALWGILKYQRAHAYLEKKRKQL